MTPIDSGRIPLSEENIRAGIAELEGIDLRDAAIADLVPRIGKLMAGLSVNLPTFNAGTLFFRAVKVPSPYFDRSRIGYPPSWACSKLGRLNEVGEQLFYCSSNDSAPFFELDEKLGTLVALGYWVTTKPLQVMHLGYVPANFEGDLLQREMPWWGREKLSVESLRMLSTWLAKRFVERIQSNEEHQYKMTIAIKRSMNPQKGGECQFPGTMYPSIASMHNSDNLAISKHFADSSMELKGVSLVELIGREGICIHAKLPDRSLDVLPSGHIVWEDRSTAFSVPYFFHCNRT
jgi:hypothetical protein